jgi:Na+-driven multidrug efflux pump
MFTNNSNVIGIGSEYLTVVSLFYWMFTIMFVVNGLLRGAGATMVPMLTTLVSLWAVRVPAAFLLSKYIGESGIWWSIPIGWVFGMIGAYAYYKTGKWKNKTVFHRSKMSQSEEAMMGEMEV